MPHYDAIVIGSGQAGNPLSQKLADLGWAVALVEKEYLGGTCINTGCTPTKTLVASAYAAHLARRAAVNIHNRGPLAASVRSFKELRVDFNTIGSVEDYLPGRIAARVMLPTYESIPVPL